MTQIYEIDVLVSGYGIIPKLVMKDKDLTIEAKAIYAYIASYAGAGKKAYPSVDLICSDLNIGKDRFQKHRKCLIEKGYLIIEKVTNKGRFTNNLYVISQTISTEQEPNEEATATQTTWPDFTAVADSTTDLQGQENHVGNNNKLNINSLNNNNLNNKTDDDDDDQINKQEKNVQKNWQEKWHYHFGDQQPYTQQIQDGLLHWLRLYGDMEVLDHAFLCAGRYGAKSYQYLNAILRNWWEEGLHTVDEIYEQELFGDF